MNPYAQTVLDRECSELAGAAPGGRNARLNRAAFALGKLIGAGDLERHVVEDRLHWAAEACGYVGDDGLRAAHATIRSGIDSGMQQPRGFSNGHHHETDPPNKPNRTDNQDRSAPFFPNWTPPDSNGKPRFEAVDNPEPPRIPDEVRRHVYRRRGMSVRAKIKRQNGQFVDFYRVTNPDTGEIGWQAKKPPAGYVVVPYIGSIDPFSDENTSAIIFCPEGEKDVDTLGRHGLPAFTFGGSSDVPDGCEEFVRGRDVVVLADNDKPGRGWAEKISARFSVTATKVRAVHFPELREGGDVSEWFAQFDGSVDALWTRVEKAPVFAATPSDCRFRRSRPGVPI
jgi:hypothetical protein